MSKRTLSLLLSLVCLVGILAGSTTALGDAAINKEGMPIVNEPITLHIMAIRGSAFQNGYADMEIFKEYEKESGIHIEWEEVAEEGWTERVKLALAAGSDLPDVFYGGEIDSATIFKYAQQGIIIPLNDLIENYSVNMKKWLAEREDLRKVITYKDGNIYSLPNVDESIPTKVQSNMLVNQTWLDRVGLEAPTTKEEFHNMLKVFKEKDANGNGIIGDEVCFSFVQYDTPNVVDQQTSLVNMFGLFGVVDDNSHVMIRDDVVTYVPTSDGYREGVEFFHQLYEEGLLDPESFTQNDSQLASKSRSPEGIGFGLAFSYMDLGNGEDDPLNNYVFLKPMENQIVAQRVLVAGLGNNRFTITSSNPYPEATIRWIDTFMDNDVRAVAMRFGKEGETWDWIDETKDKWTELAQTPDGTTVDAAYISQFCPTWHAVFWELQDMWSRKQNTKPVWIKRAALVREHFLDIAVQTWPGLALDESVLQEYTDIDTELRKYTDNMLATFIMTGVTDDQWNAYVEHCRQLGCDTLVKIYQDRWNEYASN